jgi:hypothetical protein
MKKFRADNSGNACYQSVQNLPSSNLLSKNINIKVYRTIILPVENCALLGYYASSSIKPEDSSSYLLRSGSLKSRIILPDVVYGCESWFLTLREEHMLRA